MQEERSHCIEHQHDVWSLVMTVLHSLSVIISLLDVDLQISLLACVMLMFRQLRFRYTEQSHLVEFRLFESHYPDRRSQ